MLLVKSILARMSEVSLTDAKSPQEDLEEGDRVVGILTDDLKRLHVVMVKSIKTLKSVTQQIDEWIKSLEGKEIPEYDEAGRKKKFFLATIDCETLTMCFWNSVRNEFPEIAGEKSIGLRKDWQVVVSDPFVKLKKELFELFEEVFSS